MGNNQTRAQSQDDSIIGGSSSLLPDVDPLELVPKRSIWSRICCQKRQVQASWKMTSIDQVQTKYREFQWRKRISLTLSRLEQTMTQIQQESILILKEFIKSFDDVDPSLEESKSETERPTSMLDDRQIVKESEKRFYKTIMKVIEKQLRDKQNPLHIIYSEFLAYFIEEIYYSQDQIMQFKWCATFCDQLKGFIDLQVFLIFTYYQLDQIITQQYLKCFSQNNLSSFCITIVFEEQFVHNKIVQIFRDLYDYENTRYQKKTKELFLNEPAFYGVPQHLELQPTEECSIDEDMIRNPTVQKKTMDDPKQPYQAAIDKLKMIETKRSPTHQLKYICQSIDEISNCIDEYYQTNKVKLAKNFGADELVPILLYIVVRAQIQDLGIILKIVETFTPKNSLNSSAGYKLVTLTNCYNIILNYQTQKPRSQHRNNSKSYAVFLEKQRGQAKAQSFNMEY